MKKMWLKKDDEMSEATTIFQRLWLKVNGRKDGSFSSVCGFCKPIKE